MTWRYVSALMATHGLGGAKLENTGFDGFWSDAENHGKFSNSYFKQVLASGWVPERNVGGNAGKVQWQRGDTGKSDTHKQMMLDTDLCLPYANNIMCGARDEFGVKIYDCRWSNRTHLSALNNGDCCAFTRADRLYQKDVLTSNTEEYYCGVQGFNLSDFDFQRSKCCEHEPSTSYGDCDNEY